MRHRAVGALVALAAVLAGCSSSPASVSTSGSAAEPMPISTRTPDASGSPAVDPSPTTPAAMPGFSIQAKSRDDLRNYSEFTFMSATTTGLSAAAAAVADERIQGMVDAAVSEAVAGDDNDCLDGVSKCGYFQQSLKPIACTDGYLCIQQDVYAAPVGMAISDLQVAVLVMDPRTGRTVSLSEVVPAKNREAFLTAVNSAVSVTQKSAGVYDANDAPNFSEADFAAWAPLGDGVHVWFPKYTAGGGFMGVVEVVVSKGDVRRAKRTQAAPQSSGIVTNWTDLYAYYCPRDPAELPRLVDADSDSYATSVLQALLTSWQYDTGPVDGQYGPTTRRAVRAYQRDMGLVVDGLVGPQTWGALRNVCESEGGTTQGPATGGGEDATTPQPQVTTAQPQVTVPNVVGMDPVSAGRALSNAGLSYSVQPAGGVSVAQQSRPGCVVVSQNPRAGQQATSGTFVSGSYDCPAIPAPAPPQAYTGADSGQYNGPAPPPAWTGR